MVRLQAVEVLLPQSPPQEIKLEPALGLAVKVILWPEIKPVWHTEPQVRPEPVMVPLPEPDLVRVML